MKKLIGIIAIIALAVTGFLYIPELLEKDQKVLREEVKILREYPPKEVEVFRIGKDKPEIEFSKTATAKSISQVVIVPQVTGQITKINIQVGDEVKENQVIMELGDSLSTDLMDLQYESAKETKTIAEKSKTLTEKLNLQTIKSAQIGIESSKETYQNAKESESNAKDLFDIQIESAEMGLEVAQDAYDELKEGYKEAKNAIEEMEETYEAIKSNENSDLLTQLKNAVALFELEKALEQTNSQIATLKSAKKNAKNGLEQTELTIEQLENSIEAQLSQLDYAIQMACLQYQSAISQLETLLISTQLQELGLEGQIIQANSSVEMAKINKEYLKIKSPIKGTVTSLSAEKGNLTSPGQILAKVENLEGLSVITSVNENESRLLQINDKVKIKTSNGIKEGKITSISPTLNQITKKIDIEIQLDNEDIIPESFVKATFSPNPTKIFIPLNSVTIKNDEKTVKTIDEKLRVKCKKVETGQIIGEFIEITSGLNGDETIISNITTSIEDGEKVALIN